MSDTRKTHRAVKTTIVGGQPPGNERETVPVPVGLEELLSMAAVDPEFERALLADAPRAAAASGVPLTPTELAILRSMPPAALEPMIARVRPTLPEPERRAFLELAGAAVAALLAGTVAASSFGGCGGEKKKPSKKGAIRDRQPTRHEATDGMRPDRPQPRPAPEDSMGPGRPPTRRDAGTKRLRPKTPRPNRGVSPARRRERQLREGRITGIAPDRPKKPTDK